MTESIAPFSLTRPRAFLSGVSAELPLLLGVFPFGMIYGVLATQAGLPVAAAQGMSSILFAGSSQFMAAQLMASSTPWFIVVFTIFIINLRHGLYSASIAPYLRPLSALWKCVLAYLLTDEAYAIAINHYQEHGAHRTAQWFFLGAGLTLWSGWQISTLLGIFLGAQIPASWGLDFTLALTFIALVVPALKDRPTALAALSAGLVSLVTYGLPYKLGLILAALIGILVGMVSEKRCSKSG